MELLLCFALFVAAMAVSLSFGVTMILPLIVGLLAFGTLALRRGFSLRSILGMVGKGMWSSRMVMVIMLLIGCLTSLWRQSGTIAYFTYYGVRLIPPQAFILAAFVLSALMSYALGTSFGVAATIGVILMTIARASGVSTVIAGGAIFSGIYFGDRGSPAASSASLVANETGTDASQNFKRMMPSALLPLGLCVLIYAALSLWNRPGAVDSALLARFQGEFALSLWCLLPTVLLLALAFAGMKIKYVMAIDVLVSLILTLVLQKTSLLDALRMMLLGYVPRDPELTAILSGGGMKSMLEIVCILLLSSGCSGIFEGTKMLSSVEGALRRLCGRIGRFPAMVLTSIATACVFCNQTIGIIMCRQCMGGNYPDTDQGRIDLMLDIENSVVTLSGLVPWCIACSVPMGMLGLDVRALPFACFLYLIPLCWHFQLRRRARRAQTQARAH